jgi:16S rRNA (adenine1518-N6/adenine1519-N6)-dimethyltransferase
MKKSVNTRISQDLIAKKGLGQHFLTDELICQDIVAATLPCTNNQLLEIGPGPGAITKYLQAEQDLDLRCIELDEEKVNYLNKQYPKLKGKILLQDVLQSEPPFTTEFDVVGNFPYNISTQIVFKILDWQHLVPQVVGMFQKEVAVRFASKHGSKDYGITSVIAQCYYDIELLFDVANTCFTPPPKVQSAVLKMKRNDNPHNIADYDSFRKFVKQAFSSRRKTLRNCFKGVLSAEVLQENIFDKRAEQLSVSEFAALYHRTFAK